LSEHDEVVWNLFELYAKPTTLLLPVFEVLDDVALFESLVLVVSALIVEVCDSFRKDSWRRGDTGYFSFVCGSDSPASGYKSASSTAACPTSNVH
jgi:hypothetical protein